jgi:hypothetical protein
MDRRIIGRADAFGHRCAFAPSKSGSRMANLHVAGAARLPGRIQGDRGPVAGKPSVSKVAAASQGFCWLLHEAVFEKLCMVEGMPVRAAVRRDHACQSSHAARPCLPARCCCLKSPRLLVERQQQQRQRVRERDLRELRRQRPGQHEVPPLESTFELAICAPRRAHEPMFACLEARPNSKARRLTSQHVPDGIASLFERKREGCS